MEEGRQHFAQSVLGCPVHEKLFEIDAGFMSFGASLLMRRTRQKRLDLQAKPLPIGLVWYFSKLKVVT